MVMYDNLVFATLLVSVIGFYAYQMISHRANIEHAVREETGERHKAKSHIPDMGGIVMLLIYAAFVPIFKPNLFQDSSSSLLYFMPLAFGLLGLADDLVKNKFKNTKGIPARYRIVLQIIIAVFLLSYDFGSFQLRSDVMAFRWLIILHLLFILATVNASNFTDGLDGLLAGVALCPVIGVCAISLIMSQLYKSDFFFSFIMQNPHPLVFFILLCSFLYCNRYPARMFMGDGGSMFIGGFLAAFAIISNMILPLIIMGLVIYLELLSVVIQVVSFKLTGKRVFPMTPLHHSFEKWGWKEQNIVWLFYGVTLFLTVVVVSLAPHFEFYIYWG